MQILCSSTTLVSLQPVFWLPKSKADLAFTMHMLAWLSTTGTAAIVEFPGVLYRGGAEQKYANISLTTITLTLSFSCRPIYFLVPA
jgi:hypothetical protein